MKYLGLEETTDVSPYRRGYFKDLENLDAKFCGVFSDRDRCCTAALLANICGLLFDSCMLCNPLDFVFYKSVFRSVRSDDC